MQDFGTDVGNVGVNVTAQAFTKLLNTLLSLLNKIYQLWKERSSAEYKLTKEKLKEAVSKTEKQQLLKKLEGSAGYINHETLKKAGVPLKEAGITCTKEELTELAAQCKRSGIIITAIDDIRTRELGGTQLYHVLAQESDFPRIKEIVDTMNDAKRIEYLKEKQGELLAKGENMTAVDKLMVKQLDKEIQFIRDGHSMALSQEQTKSVIEQAVNGKTYSGVTLAEALDRFTGQAIDKDTTCYIVDAKNPDNYIVASSTQAEYNGDQYIRTDYTVYNGEQRVFETNDARFDGRPKDYWSQQKAAMQEKGNIGDTVIKFYDRADLDAYRAEFARQNKQELDGLQQGVMGRDYDKIISDALIPKIDECGGRYDEATGKVVDKETGEPFALSDGMSVEEQAKVAEAAVCAKQIQNYRDIQSLESQMSIAKADVLVAAEGTMEHARATVELQTLEEKYGAAVEREASLIDERKGVNFVQSEQEVRENKEKEAEQDLSGEDRPRGEDEKSDDRRDDRVDENDPVRSSMAEYEGEIANRRVNEGAKAPDANDRSVAHEMSAQKSTKPKAAERE